MIGRYEQIAPPEPEPPVPPSPPEPEPEQGRLDMGALPTSHLPDDEYAIEAARWQERQDDKHGDRLEDYTGRVSCPYCRSRVSPGASCVHCGNSLLPDDQVFG